MAVGVGFEPTELLHPTVFKTAAINRTLPTYRMAGDERVELPPTESKSAVLPLYQSPMLWWARRDSNPQNYVSKTYMYASSITRPFGVVCPTVKRLSALPEKE